MASKRDFVSQLRQLPHIAAGHLHDHREYGSSNNNNNNNNNSDDMSGMLQQIECTINANLSQLERARRFCAYCGIKAKSDIDSLDERDTPTAVNVALGRCYGCQMIYYCSQTHQHLDWLANHMSKCAELEWVALGELIQSMPIRLPLPELGSTWPSISPVSSWADWFDMRGDVVRECHRLARTFAANFFSSSAAAAAASTSFRHRHGQLSAAGGFNRFNRREPDYNDLVDGLLASVTDSLTHALTVGHVLRRLKQQRTRKPLRQQQQQQQQQPRIDTVLIHILHPPSELFDDLAFLIATSLHNDDLVNNIGDTKQQQQQQYETLLAQRDIDHTIKRKFHELVNMLAATTTTSADVERRFHFVLISTDTLIDLPPINGSPVAATNSSTMCFDWSKHLRSPAALFIDDNDDDEHENENDEDGMHISAWCGTYADYLRERAGYERATREPDLVVAFHPAAFSTLSSKSLDEQEQAQREEELESLMHDLDAVMAHRLPCLLTFNDRVSKERAAAALNARIGHLVAASASWRQRRPRLVVRPNEFSSLRLKQVPHKPNEIYAANSYYILIRDGGFGGGYAAARRQRAKRRNSSSHAAAHGLSLSVDALAFENRHISHVNNGQQQQRNSDSMSSATPTSSSSSSASSSPLSSSSSSSKSSSSCKYIQRFDFSSYIVL